jgi:hypothetical protein
VKERLSIRLNAEVEELLGDCLIGSRKTCLESMLFGREKNVLLSNIPVHGALDLRRPVQRLLDKILRWNPPSWMARPPSSGEQDTRDDGKGSMQKNWIPPTLFCRNVCSTQLTAWVEHTEQGGLAAANFLLPVVSFKDDCQQRIVKSSVVQAWKGGLLQEAHLSNFYEELLELWEINEKLDLQPVGHSQKKRGKQQKKRINTSSWECSLENKEVVLQYPGQVVYSKPSYYDSKTNVSHVHSHAVTGTAGFGISVASNLWNSVSEFEQLKITEDILSRVKLLDKKRWSFLCRNNNVVQKVAVAPCLEIIKNQRLEYPTLFKWMVEPEGNESSLKDIEFAESSLDSSCVVTTQSKQYSSLLVCEGCKIPCFIGYHLENEIPWCLHCARVRGEFDADLNHEEGTGKNDASSSKITKSKSSKLVQQKKKKMPMLQLSPPRSPETKRRRIEQDEDERPLSPVNKHE